ncbi:hypothetical protein LG299_07815 [Microbacterium lacus]|uniref:hypothetical protein n=1 Tax=Microbacterium lacus TaxID=415217 RepID=UPI00384AF088
MATRVAVCAVIAAGLASCDGAPATSQYPHASSAGGASPEPTADMVAHTFSLPPFPSFQASAPRTWNAVDGWVLNRDPCADAGCTEEDTMMAVMWWRVTEVYAEPCNWQGSTFDPGQTVTDLATALSAVPTRNASEPVPTSVDGAQGLYLEWSVPSDADFAVCDDGIFESWTGDVGGTDRYQQAPGQVDRIWIVDVDGERLVINAFFLPATPEADRREIDAVINSIEFER